MYSSSTSSNSSPNDKESLILEAKTKLIVGGVELEKVVYFDRWAKKIKKLGQKIKNEALKVNS
jgi:hypothetical protein